MSYASFAELLSAAEQNHTTLGKAVLAREVFETDAEEHEVRAQMTESLGVMRGAVERGLDGQPGRAAASSAATLVASSIPTPGRSAGRSPMRSQPHSPSPR